MGYTFAPIEYNCADELIPKYLDRIGRASDAFLCESLSQSDFYEMRCDGERVGFLALRGSRLTGFYTDENKYATSGAAFDAAREQLDFGSAQVASFDSSLIALSSTRWKNAQVDSHCFEFSCFSSPPRFEGAFLRCAQKSDTEALLNTGYFQSETLAEMTRSHSVYVCADGGTIKAFGTIEPIRYRKDTALVGVYVADSFRSCGLGLSVLCRLTGICNDYGIKPLALCPDKNTAFASALKGAGYVSFDKFLKVTF